MKFSTIGTKIGTGYLMIILLMALIIGATIYQTGALNEISKRIYAVDNPSIDSAHKLVKGINESMAALRGWIILGDATLAADRDAAWNETILPSLTALEKLSPQWDDSANADRLAELRDKLEEVSVYQASIQHLAHTEENTPALFLLKTEGIPQAETMLQAAATLIAKESLYESTAARKELLIHLADTQGTLASALIALRTYLITGEDEFRTRFETLWEQNEQSLAVVKASKNLLSKIQWDNLNELLDTRAAFSVTQQKMIELRSSDDWNKAEAKLRKQASPLAREINGLTRELIADIQQKQQDNLTKQQEITELQYRTEWFLLGVGLVFSIILGLNTTRAIARPIANAADMAREVADGNYNAYFNPTQIDELKRLGQALADMQEKIQTNQADLEKARAEAEASSRTRGIMLASISHALRTPVNAVIGFSEALAEGVNGPVTQLQKDNLNRINQAGNSSLLMLNDLLDLSKMESGQMDLEKSAFDLRDLLKDCLDQAAPDIEKKKLTLTQTVAKEALPLEADKKRITKVLSRIIYNAVKYSDVEKEIEIRAEKDGDNLVVSVRDFGVGMSAERLKKIFAQGDSVEEKFDRLPERMGLGMMVAFKMVELHGGNISAKSEVGKGSTFHLTLPAKETSS